MTKHIGCFVFVLTSLLSHEAFAVETYECKYTSYSNQSGAHEQALDLVFLIDKDANKGYIVGNNGSEEVAYVDGRGLAFIEVTDTGNVMTTAIDQNMKSVHSRNTVLESGLVPSQYYGECVRK